MVLHEIDKIIDIKGHRLIIYCVTGKHSSTNVNLETQLCIVLEMLEKKNDDLLAVKVVNPSDEFEQFQEVYQLEVSSPATLLVVNDGGIPIMCEHINNENSIYSALERISTKCDLNCISKMDVNKITLPKTETIEFISKSPISLEVGLYGQARKLFDEGGRKSENIISETLSQINNDTTSTTQLSNDSKIPDTQQPSSTKLQIRLPNGNKHQEIFDKNTTLQEVQMYISSSFNIKYFDLKTYNHHFTEDEYIRSLKDLDLYPSGVITVVVKNVKPFRPRTDYNGIVGTIQYGFQEFLRKTSSLFLYIQGIVFTYWNSFKNNNQGQGRRQIKPLTGFNEGKQGPSRHIKTRVTVSPSGNIHTLKRNDDSDDENSRYNGNSTQQK